MDDSDLNGEFCGNYEQKAGELLIVSKASKERDFREEGLMAIAA